MQVVLQTNFHFIYKFAYVTNFDWLSGKLLGIHQNNLRQNLYYTRNSKIPL